MPGCVGNADRRDEKSGRTRRARSVLMFVFYVLRKVSRQSCSTVMRLLRAISGRSGTLYRRPDCIAQFHAPPQENWCIQKGVFADFSPTQSLDHLNQNRRIVIFEGNDEFLVGDTKRIDRVSQNRW